jgi:hypothetical protein
MDFNSIFKKILPHLIAIAAMFVVSSVYFFPAWEGETLSRDDIVKGRGGIIEKLQYREYENENILWTNSRFSGMPDFIGANYESSNVLKRIYNIPQKLGVPVEVALLLWYMIGFYILLIAFRVNPWLAIGGAIAFGLTSYNLIIIDAGHFKKVRTIAFIAPTIAGFILTYRRKYLAGFALTAFFLAQQIAHDHVQMSYYLLLGFICMGLVQLYYHIKNKELLQFAKSTGVLIFAALLAVGPNYSKLSNLYRYNKETIRGKSELTIGKEEIKTESGLDRDYINMWSSGKAESMMLFAPKVKGGASGYVRQDRDLLREIDSRFREVIGNMNQYWGNQPGSGGPNSAGAVIFFLFFIGLFLIKGPLKKGILISVLLYVLLSWGDNFSAFTNLFIDYVPLYNKFRAPVSILAVGVVFIAFFAFYTAGRVIQKPDLLKEESKIKIGSRKLPVYLAAGLGFIGFLLINILFPNLFNSYLSDVEINMFDNYRAQGNAGQIDTIVATLKDLRIHVFRMEMLRTLLFSGAALAALVLFKKEKIKKGSFIALIAILAIIDVWTIGKRYVNEDNFTKTNLIEEEYRLSDIDKQIYSREIQENPELRQKIEAAYQKFNPENEIEREKIQNYVIRNNSFYRVLNLTTSTFQENATSGSHRSIGGYHAAKLRRYQDMIEFHISQMNRQVLNMLNAKYIITQDGLQVNRNVMGPAWFVNSVVWADDPDEEIMLLDSIDVSEEVVVNEKDEDRIGNFSDRQPGDTITLEEYHPDHMVYRSVAAGTRIAVFSEVFYPDWKVLVDGEPAEYFTANYILRGMVVPEGEHKIEFIFNPPYFSRANQISMVLLYLLFAVVIGLTGYGIYSEFKKRKQVENAES